MVPTNPLTERQLQSIVEINKLLVKHKYNIIEGLQVLEVLVIACVRDAADPHSLVNQFCHRVQEVIDLE